MTQVEVVYRFSAAPSEAAAYGVSKLREVYGIRRLELNERERTVRVEYDSSRLTEAVIHGLLRRGGLDITERVEQTRTPDPAPAPAAT